MRGTYQNVPLKIKLSVISNRDVIERLNSRFAFGIQIPAFVEHERLHLTDIQNGIKHCGFDEVNHVFLIFKATGGWDADMLATVLHADAADSLGKCDQFIPAFPVVFQLIAGFYTQLSDLCIQQDNIAVANLGIGCALDIIVCTGQCPLQFPIAFDLWNGGTCLSMALDINAVKCKDDLLTKISAICFIKGDIMGILHTSIIRDPIQNHRLKFVISGLDRLTSGSIDPFTIFVSGGTVIKSTTL